MSALLTPIPGEPCPLEALAVDRDMVLALADVMRGPTVSVHRRVCDCPTENVELFGHRQGCAAYSVG